MRNSLLLMMLIALLHPLQLFAESGEEQTVEESIRAQFAQLPIESIRKTEIDGLYEIAFQDNIVYYHPQSGLTLVGEILTQEGMSLTARKKAEMTASRIEDLPLEKAIKIGSGKHTVIEVVDPDCPFCRKTAAFFKKRKDVTRYIFLFPITQIHPDAERKAQYILCAQDKPGAYAEALSGRLDDEDFKLCDDAEVKELLLEHQRIGQLLGVRGTPTMWINGQFVSGANFEKILQILEPKS
ncbi:DsbC family protein [Candidatus Manganitrophus noduliformans]|uniref:DsbC family protein n=1 Tax=Candidatus Manganitrophus noduliformans TaxID=2606439 RepID=A0A7X6DMW0_9BACT|nr:DsbC family protein [Candidatus Manganitrophus noduliformans]NKE70156.1 DsbC family protein [Candidatus Manganitrophus noduliformans]